MRGGIIVQYCGKREANRQLRRERGEENVVSKWTKALLAVGLLACGQSARAEPIYYDCDAPGGSFSKIEVVQNHSDYRVRGSITPYQVRGTATWLPTANVRIEGQDNGAGFSISHHDAETFSVSIKLVQEGELREIHLPLTLNLNQSLEFEIVSASDGQSYVSIGGRLPFQFTIEPGAKIVASCSSGGFKFNQLDWATPATP